MNVRPLSSNLQKKAIQELNEDPKRIQEAFDHINEWLQKQPHLNIRKDDQLMIAFLRGCKWNLQRTKEKLDKFYSVRSKIPEFFANRDPLSSDVQNVLNAGIVFPLPKRENHIGPVILIYSLRNADVKATPFAATLKLFFMTLDILMREDDDFVVSGVRLIANNDDCSHSYYLQFTPSLLKNYVACFQNYYPVRIVSAVTLNTVAVFDTIYNVIIKPFVSKKLQERVRVINASQTKAYFKEFPPDVFPEEYGGTNGLLKDAAEKWKRKVESYREWFLDDANYFTNERLRIGGAKYFENDIGIDGTFRNLTID